MTILEEHQFEILPSESALNGFVFGIGSEVSVESFDPGETNWVTQDSQNTRRGNVGFGRDILGGRTWTWESFIDRQDVKGALDTLDRFSAAWGAEELVRNPGAVTAIRYRVGGRYRRVFGRPRRLAAPPSNLILGGLVPVTHDFSLVDNYSYDDAPSSTLITYSSAVSGGGFVLPAVMPVSSLPSNGNGEDTLSVKGTSRAYPVIRFNGPWINPVMTTDHWTLRWTGTVPAGGWVEFDCRPWALTVKDQSGASRASGLDRRTWLEDIFFEPQTQPQVSLSGSSSGGSASALIRWRDTWTSI